MAAVEPDVKALVVDDRANVEELVVPPLYVELEIEALAEVLEL
jgi:hypothetical protein